MRRVIGALALWCAVMAFTGGKPSSYRITIHQGSWQLEVIQTDSLAGINQTLHKTRHQLFPDTTIAFDTTYVPIDSVTTDTVITADTTVAQVDSLVTYDVTSTPDTLCVDVSKVEYHANGDASHYGYGGSIYNAAPVGDSVSVDVKPCPDKSGEDCVGAGATVNPITVKHDLNGQQLIDWVDDITAGGGVLSQYKMFIFKNADKHTAHGYHVIIQQEARR